MIGKFRITLDPLIRSSEHPLIAVAVSGGSDSMALALLTKQCGFKVAAVTVDHRLRPESVAEAAQVAAWMAAREIPHDVLTWQHEGNIRGNLQLAAREARYELLTGFCRERRISHLLIGHTEDDQAETVALRQERAAGAVGLAGMSARICRNGVTGLRPLLGYSRAELREYLRECGQEWIEDPSNNNTDFDRIRIRQELATHPDRRADLLALGRKMAEKRKRIEKEFLGFAEKHVTVRAPGMAFERGAFLSLPPETAIYALSRILPAVSGRRYPPRYRELQRLAARLHRDENGKATLGRCLIGWKKNHAAVALEFSAEAPHIHMAKPLVSEPFCCIEDL